MVTAILGILERKIIAESEMIEWFNSFSEIKKTGKHDEDLVRKVNIKVSILDQLMRKYISMFLMH